MKKIIPLSIILIWFLGCISYSPQFTPNDVVANVARHTVAIVVTYPNDSPYSSDPYTMYIGAGAVISDNRILTVAHLFEHGRIVEINAVLPYSGLDHPVKCEVIKQTDRSDDFTNDYALLRMKEDVGLPGLKVASKDVLPGEKVIFAGTVGGMCITRFGFCTYFKYFFKVDEGVLKLAFWHDDAFITVYPGGNGDSGGTICNTKGEIVGVMYCGIENHLESYIFSNPVHRLHKFLEE